MNTATRTTRLVPALVLSVAVIGSATAGSAVAAKMITGQDIKNGTVASVDVKNGSLTGKDVKNASVGANKLGAGVQGKLDKPNVRGYELVSTTITIPTAGNGQAFVFCPAGKVALTGGASWVTDDVLETGAAIQESHPGKAIGEFFAPLEAGDVATAWTISAVHNNIDAKDLTAYAVCVDPS